VPPERDFENSAACGAHPKETPASYHLQKERGRWPHYNKERAVTSGLALSFHTSCVTHCAYSSPLCSTYSIPAKEQFVRGRDCARFVAGRKSMLHSRKASSLCSLRQVFPGGHGSFRTQFSLYQVRRSGDHALRDDLQGWAHRPRPRRTSNVTDSCTWPAGLRPSCHCILFDRRST
jgi:hypothetical protein